MSCEFRYTKAVVRGVPDSFSAAALRLDEPEETINLAKAREQWSTYVAALKKLGLAVIEMAAEGEFPDCVFIEDTAVVCDETALITRPGHVSRQGETTAVRKILKDLGLKIVEVDEPAVMDGGDVMFTGREFFVGLSSRTNEEGVDSLRKAFPQYPVSVVKVPKGVLHLKSVLSMAGPNLIAIGQSTAAERLWKEMEENGKFQYNKLSLPEDRAANCLYINGVLVHQSAIGPQSMKVLKSLNCRRVGLDLSELAKADGCLTCCSLLIA